MTVWLEIGGKKRCVKIPAGWGNTSTADSTAGAAPLGEMTCSVDGRALSATVRLLEPGVMSLLVEGRQYRCVLDGDGVVIGGRRVEFAVQDPRSLQGRACAAAGAEGPRPVKAPMPGRVVRLLAAVGDDVVEGQGVVVIEAMKMQNELKSPKAGRVVRISATVGDTVGSGDVLVVVE